jgi:CRP-like cAMP-binding protein
MSAEYKVLQVAADTLLFEEDSHGDEAYLLKSGRVALTKNINGAPRLLTVLKAPIMFGEMALIQRDPTRSASARTLDACELVTINREAFEGLLKNCPQMMQTTIELLVQRLKTCTARVLHVPDIHQAVIRSLFTLQQHQVKFIDYALFVQDTALIINQSPKDIESIIDRLVAANLVEKRKNQFKATELCFMQTQDFVKTAMTALTRKH